MAAGAWDFNHCKSCFEEVHWTEPSQEFGEASLALDAGLKAPEEWKSLPKSVRIDSSLPACCEFVFKQEVRYLYCSERDVNCEIRPPARFFETPRGPEELNYKVGRGLTIASACYDHKSRFWMQWGHPEESKTTWLNHICLFQTPQPQKKIKLR